MGHRGWQIGKHACPWALALVALASVVLALVALTSGCTVYSPAARQRDPDDPLPQPQSLLSPTDWPSRRTSDLASVVARTPREISWWRLDGSKPPSDIEPRLLERVQRPEAIVSYSGVHGVGIIRVFDSPPASSASTDRPEQSSPAPSPSAGEGPPVSAAGRPFAPMRFVSLSEVPGRPTDQRIKRLQRWIERSASSPSRRPGVSMNDPEVLAMLWEGTGIRVVPPKLGVPPVGTVLHMPGLGSLEYEQPVLDELSARGWWIVRVATPRLWWLEDQKFTVNAAGDIPPLAETIARLVDDLLAEPAYAAEAGLDYLASHRPEVPQRPLVLLGMSAGSLMMPAVAARLHSRVDGMVLIGAGANLLQISQESDLTDGGLKIDWADDLPRGRLRERLYSHYLESSRLDPYALGPTLQDLPTLLVLASMDTIVPASSGRLLWERLGRPERYTTPFGHALLFWQLSSQALRIASWIDAAGAHSAHRPTADPPIPLQSAPDASTQSAPPHPAPPAR